MVNRINFPDNSFIDFPDDTPEDVVNRVSRDYARDRGLLDPSVGSLIGAGVDLAQSQLSNIPIALADKVIEESGTPSIKETASEWKDIFDNIRSRNREEADKVTELMIEPQKALDQPGKFIKQQIAFQSPQLLGLTVAAANPYGKVLGPVAAHAYFTATNLDRQREEGQEYNLLKAAGFAGGQAATETLFMNALGNLPGGALLPTLGKLAATGVGGEVVQQLLERGAADLDLTDKEAVNEYVDSAIGATVFVGVGAPVTYIATRNGNLTPVSDKVKEKLSKGERVSPEEIVEEQMREIPDVIELPDADDPTQTISLSYDEIVSNKLIPDLEEKSEAILLGAGLDPSHFKNPVDKYKAASVALKNTVDDEIISTKTRELRDAGVDPQVVTEYSNNNPSQFYSKETEQILSEINGIPVEEAITQLEPVRQKQGQLQREAINFAVNPDFSLDTDVEYRDLRTTLDDINKATVQTKDLVQKAPRRLYAEDLDQEIPSWLQRQEAEGVRRSLNIKPKDVKRRLSSGLESEGYREFLPPVVDKDLSGAVTNEINKGRKASKLAAAQDAVTSKDLERTFNQFAQNEANLINYKRQVDRQRPPPQGPQQPQAELTSVRPEVSILEKVQPIAEQVDVLPTTVPFVDNVLRTVTRTINNRARGMNLGKVSDRLLTDPIYKVQYANFIDTIMKSNQSTPISPSQGVEQFYFMFDHTGVLNREEKRALSKKFPTIYKGSHEYFGLDAPNKETIIGPEAQKEFIANIYDQFSREGNKKVLNGVPQDVKDIIRKLDRFKTQMAREVQRRKVFDQSQLITGLEDGLDSVRETRLGAITDETVANKVFQDLLDGAALAEEQEIFNAIDVERESGGSKYNKALGLWTSWKSSLQSLATKSPLAAQVLKVIDFRDQLRSTRQTELRKMNFRLSELENQVGAGFVQQISERIHRLEEANGSYDLSTPGQVTFLNSKGKPIGRIRNERVFEGYSIIDQLKQTALDMEETSLRKNLKYFGINNENATINDITQFITLVEGQNNINKLSDPEQSRMVEERLVGLKNILRDLKTKDEMRTKAFFPRVRSGSLGLVVYDSSGKQVHFSQFNEESHSLTRQANKGELEDIIREVKNKYSDGGYKVYGFDGAVYSVEKLDAKTFKPINLSRNRELARHNINSLISAYDLLEDMGGLTDKSDRLKRLRDTFELRAQGNFNYFGDRRFIDGYEKDPFKTLETFAQRFANQVTSREYASQLKTIDRELAKYSEGTEANAVIQTIRERMQYALDPQEALGFLKAFNFTYAMGGSLKSAIVQLTQLFTLSQGYADALNLSPIRNKLMTAKALKEAGKFVQFKDGVPLVDIDNPNNVSKIFDNVSNEFLNKEQKDFYKKITSTRHFESLQQKVYLEGRDYANKKFKNSGLVNQTLTTLDKVLSPLNSLIGSTESVGRLANTFLFTEMFTKDPKALQRFEKMVGNEPKYQVFQDQYAKIGGDKASIAALYMLDETFLVTGSTGKNRIATTGFMNAVTPFANFSTQLVGALNRQFSRDPKALALGILYAMMFGGIAGVPFYGNVKELLDFLFKRLGMGPMDLELEVREAIFNATNNPKLAQAVTKGIPAATLGVDLSGSVQQELPVFNQVLKAFDPDTKFSEVVSMPTSFASGIGKGLYDLVKASYDPYAEFDGAQFIQDVVPYKAVRDLGKAYASATKPITTRQGQPLLPKQSDDPVYLALTAMGFTPSKLTEARARYWFEQINSENTEMNNKRQQRNDLWIKFYNETNPQKKDEYKSLIKNNAKEAALVAREKNLNFNVNQYIRDGMMKGKQVVTGKRDPKRLPKAQRREQQKVDEMFMVQ